MPDLEVGSWQFGVGSWHPAAESPVLGLIPDIHQFLPFRHVAEGTGGLFRGQGELFRPFDGL